MSIYAINKKNILVADFAGKKKATILFPSLFTDTSIHNVVKQFQLHINIMIVDKNNVCVCYNWFILFRTCILLTKVHPEFVLAIQVAVIVDDDLDCYRYINNSSHFSNSCYGMTVQK